MRAQKFARSGEAQGWRSMPIVTVRTSSLCWRIMPSVARTSSVRYNGVSLGFPGRPHADGARLAGGQKDVLVLDEGFQPVVASEPLELGPHGARRQVGGQKGLHD